MWDSPVLKGLGAAAAWSRGRHHGSGARMRSASAPAVPTPVWDSTALDGLLRGGRLLRASGAAAVLSCQVGATDGSVGPSRVPRRPLNERPFSGYFVHVGPMLPQGLERRW